MSLTTPGNSLLWSRLGNMVLSGDGRVLIGGSVDPYMTHFLWNADYFNTGGDSFVAALSLETGQIRLLEDAAGVALHDVSVVSLVGDSSTANSNDDWYYPSATTLKLVIARHGAGVQKNIGKITWTNGISSIETLRFVLDDLVQSCPAAVATTSAPATTPTPANATNSTTAPPTNATNATATNTTTSTPAPQTTASPGYSGGGLVSCPQQCVGLRGQEVEREAEEMLRSVGGRGEGVPVGELAALLEGRQMVVVDGTGQLRLVSSSALRDLLQDAKSKSTNPAFEPL